MFTPNLNGYVNNDHLHAEGLLVDRKRHLGSQVSRVYILLTLTHNNFSPKFKNASPVIKKHE